MAIQNKLNVGKLTFENFPGKPSDMRISKVLSTPNGDKVRAVVTSARTLTLAQVRRVDDFDMTVTVIGDGDGDVAALEIDWGKLWGIAKKVAGAVLGGLDGGGGGNCPPPVQITGPLVTGSNSGTTINICVQNCGNQPK